MVAVYFLLIEEAMAAGTCIVGLIFYKLLILSIGKHLVKHKIHNILQVFVVLVFGTFLYKLRSTPSSALFLAISRAKNMVLVFVSFVHS